MNYLVFRLYGAMASWGEIAVGETRQSARYPSKSAITGLLAAALGIKRECDEKHLALVNGYQQAIKLVKTGQILKDYHTAQAPDSVGKYSYQTRRDELLIGKDRIGTVLSSREYRTDAQAVVAIQAMDDAPYSVSELQQALQTPKFHLYLGRKSCPLAAPLAAQIVAAAHFYDALNQYSLNRLLQSDRDWESDKRYLPDDARTHYYWEGSQDDFAKESDVFCSSHIQIVQRHDKPMSRKRWQFQSRNESMWLHKKETS